MQALGKEVTSLRDNMSAMKGDDTPLLDAPAAAKVREEFRGISAVLDEIMSKQADLAGPIARAADEGEKLRDRLQEAREKLKALHAEGKLSADDYAGQMQDLRIAQVMLPELVAGMAKKAGDAVVAAVAETHAQLQQELARQGPQTLAAKLAEWDAEQAARRTKLIEQGQRDGADETANLELLGEVYTAGVKKLWDDAGAAEIKGNDELQAEIAAQTEQAFDAKRAAWNRHIDEEIAAYAKEGHTIEAAAERFAATRKTGLDKLAAEEKAAGDAEMARLGEQLERINREHQRGLLGARCRAAAGVGPLAELERAGAGHPAAGAGAAGVRIIPRTGSRRRGGGWRIACDLERVRACVWDGRDGGSGQPVERRGHQFGRDADGDEYDNGNAGAEMKTVQKTAYIAFVLRACGNARTELFKICPETPDAGAAIRNRVARLKPNWGAHSALRRVVLPGEVAKDGGDLRG
jgi:uncharacterized protein YukE